MSWQTSSQLIPLVFNLALTPWIITGLGPERYSIFMLVTAFTSVIAQFDGGIGPSAMRYFTLYASRKDREATARLLLSVSGIVLVAGITFTVAVFWLTDTILTFFKVSAAYFPEAEFLLRVLTMIVAFNIVRNLLNAVINAHQLFRFTSLATLAGYVVYIAGVVGSIVWGWGLYGVAWTMVLQQVAGSLITVPPSLRYVQFSKRWYMDRAALGDFFRYAWKVQVTGITALLTSQKDQLVAGRMLSAQQSGPYGQGAAFAVQMRMIPLNATYPMQALIGSEVSLHGARASVDKVEKLQRIWVRAVVGWFAIAAVAAWFAVRAWLPAEFSVAAPVASALLIGSGFQLVSHVANLWCLTLGFPNIAMHAASVGFAANVAVSFGLGLIYGMPGVIAGSVSGSVAAMAFFSYLYHRKIDVQLRWFVREVPWAATALGMALTLALELWAGDQLPNGALGLVFGGLLAAPGFLLHLVVAFGLRDVRNAANRLLHRAS